MADPEGDCQFVYRNNRRITVAAFKAAEILLTEARNFRKPLLRQTFLLSYPPDVLSDQSAHVHADRSADYIL